MTTALLLLLLASAAPAERVVVLDIQGASVSEDVASLIQGRIAGALRSMAREVITSQDLRDVAELGSERMATGCDETSCFTAIADAMGARQIIYGSVVRLGEQYILQLRLFDSSQATTSARVEAEGGSLSAVAAQADRLTKDLFGIRQEERAADTTLFWSGIGATALGALGVASALGYGLYVDGQLRSKDVSRAAKDAHLDARGWVVGAGGASATVLVAGVVMALIGAE